MRQTCHEIVVLVGSSAGANHVLQQLLPLTAKPASASELQTNRETLTEAQQTLWQAIREAVRTLMEIAEQKSAPIPIIDPHHTLEISVWLATDEEVAALNAQYRGTNQPTDVLSFPMLDEQFPHALPGHPILLGEVVISVETAARQAAPNGHDPITEILMLCLHGTLHLLGYDDQTAAQQTEMNQIAVQTLRLLGYPAKEEWYSRHYEK